MRNLRLLLAPETKALRWLIVRVSRWPTSLGCVHLAFDGWPGCLLQGPPSWYFAEQIAFRASYLFYLCARYLLSPVGVRQFLSPLSVLSSLSYLVRDTFLLLRTSVVRDTFSCEPLSCVIPSLAEPLSCVIPSLVTPLSKDKQLNPLALDARVVDRHITTCTVDVVMRHEACVTVQRLKSGSKSSGSWVTSIVPVIFSTSHSRQARSCFCCSA